MLSLPFLILCLGAGAALIVKPKQSAHIGCMTACLGCLLFIPAFLLHGANNHDPLLSLIFQLPIVVLGIAAAIHSIDYLKGHGDEHAGFYWFCFNLMLAAMLGVTIFNAPIPFLIAWEIMGLASAALVAFDYKSGVSMHAVWVYLAACHAGAAFLILMFLQPHASVLTLFILATLGFGLKAGFPGLHVWLPEAHPAAPAPVSAIMSGAMINLGFFGLLKFGLPHSLIATDPLTSTAGWTLLTLGITGALAGILFALPQKNMKRLLAFSSIENMGIISLGIGLSLLATAHALPTAAKLAGLGAMLHVLNHALLKGGLFLGAGSVFKATGTLNLDEMGGLQKRMPTTGTLFALNATGVCGLPPLNAFVGEFCIYLAAFQGIVHGSGAFFAACLCTVIALALTGGLAAATFAKTVGAAFLGAPRSTHAAEAREVPPSMRWPIIGLFAISVLMAVVGPFLIANVLPASLEANHGLIRMGIAFLLVYGVTGGLLFLRFRLLPRARETATGLTWDCGYAQPTARMAYTGTAFTQPLVDFFSPILHPRRRLVKPDGFFPKNAAVDLTVTDAGTRFLWDPIFAATSRFATRLQATQSGYLHAYVLTLVAAIAAMFIWAMFIDPKINGTTPASPPVSIVEAGE